MRRGPPPCFRAAQALTAAPGDEVWQKNWCRRKGQGHVGFLYVTESGASFGTHKNSPDHKSFLTMVSGPTPVPRPRSYRWTATWAMGSIFTSQSPELLAELLEVSAALPRSHEGGGGNPQESFSNQSGPETVARSNLLGGLRKPKYSNQAKTWPLSVS